MTKMHTFPWTNIVGQICIAHILKWGTRLLHIVKDFSKENEGRFWQQKIIILYGSF